MNPHSIRKAAKAAAQAELRAARSWWQDDRNFRPILPSHVAERWRTPAYALGVGLAIATVAPLVHVEVNPGGTAIGVLLMVAVAALVEHLDPRSAPQPEAPEPVEAQPVRFPPAHVGETVRLTRSAAATGPTAPLHEGRSHE